MLRFFVIAIFKVMSHFVYIIESITTSKWYYGYSMELERRLEGHNNGINTSTRGRGPWKFVFVREFSTKEEALSFEQYLKKTRNKTFITQKYVQYFL